MEISVVDALQSADATVRNRAALALGAEPDPSFAEAQVAAMLVEPEPFALETMIWAIVANQDATLPLLVAALAEPRNDAERILHALSKIGDPTTVDVIRPFAAHKNPFYAGKAWWALARIGDLDAIDDLLTHLGTADTFSRESLTRALAFWGPKAAPKIIESLQTTDDAAARRHATEILVKIADPDDRGTVARRNHSMEPGVLAAIDALTNSQLPEVEETLRLLATDPDHISIAKTAADILANR